VSLVRPANVPPLRTYFADYDDRFDDIAARAHVGDVAIWRTCGHASGAAAMPAETEVAAGFGGEAWWPLCRDDFRRSQPGRDNAPQGGFQGEFQNSRHCCPREAFHDGRCWRLPPPCQREQVKLPNGQCCPPREVRDGQCGREPPPSTCPNHETRLQNGQCCPRIDVRDGACAPPPPTPCVTGTLVNGQCQPPRRVDIIPPHRRIVVDVPPRRRPDHPDRHARPIVHKVLVTTHRSILPTRTGRSVGVMPLGHPSFGGGRMTFGMGGGGMGGLGHIGGLGRR
jgi:hypothetical protein